MFKAGWKGGPGGRAGLLYIRMSNSGDLPRPPDAPSPEEEERPLRPLRLVLVRHGSSTWNESRRIQGQLDPPLSRRGREQARRLAERFRGRRPAGFYCSDLGRARETAAAIAGVIGCEPQLLPELREIALGDWEGLSREQIMERFPDLWERWVEEPDWDIVPGGERAADFEQRVSGALDEIEGRHPHGDVLVVTHGGVIQVALGKTLQWPGSRGAFPFRIQNTSISVIDIGAKRVVVSRVNDTCHLDEEPLLHA